MSPMELNTIAGQQLMDKYLIFNRIKDLHLEVRLDL